MTLPDNDEVAGTVGAVDGSDAPPSPAVSAGWHPDPFQRHELRYHNGLRWTGDVSTGGARGVDPPSPAVARAPGDRAAVASLVLGIVGASLAWLPFLVAVGALASIAALVVAHRARGRALTSRQQGQRRAGRILGIIGLVLVIPGVVLTRVVLDVFSPGPLAVTITSCESDAGRAVLQGTITNESDRARGYLVLVRFTREGTGSVLADTMVQVDEVQPGATEAFASSVSTDVTSIDCEVVDVLGGLPVDVT